MSKSDKRERQKENRERAREERERLQKRDKRMRTLRSLLIVLVPVMVILVIVSLTTSDDKAAAKPLCQRDAPKPKTRSYEQAPPTIIDPASQYTAVICTSEGRIDLALDATTAPIATNNFVALAGDDFYNGLKFHRAAKDFVIQGGDPNGDGSGGPGYTVAGEVPTDNYPVGALAAAKSGSDPAGTFGSQFFIVTGAQGATLPNDYARFGTVTRGLKVAQRIESFAPAAGDGEPTKATTIKRIAIFVNGKPFDPAKVTTTTTAASTDSTTSSTSAP